MTDKDATTEAELRAIFGHLDPVPQLLDDAARAAFGWRSVDAEIAELLRDSAEAEDEAGLLVRSGGGPRQLSFESPQVGIELEVTETGPRERRAGRPAPAARRRDRDARAPRRGPRQRAGRRPRPVRARRAARRRHAVARHPARRADRDSLDDDLDRFGPAFELPKRGARLRRGG